MEVTFTSRNGQSTKVLETYLVKNDTFHKKCLVPFNIRERFLSLSITLLSPKPLLKLPLG